MKSAFYNLQTVEKTKFSESFKNAGWIDRIFCYYMLPTMRNVNAALDRQLRSLVSSKEPILKGEDVVGIDRKSEHESPTLHETEQFKKLIDAKAEAYIKAGRAPDYYTILRNSLIQLYFPDIFVCFCLTIAS